MSFTPDQIIGVGVCVALVGNVIYNIAKNNPGVDGQNWGSNGLTWDSSGDRPNPERKQRHPARKAE